MIQQTYLLAGAVLKAENFKLSYTYNNKNIFYIYVILTFLAYRYQWRLVR